MTPRSFFNIVVKILGLYFFLNIVETIPQFISAATVLSGSDNPADASYIFLGTSIILAFYILVSFILLTRTNKVVHLLKLDQGFDQEYFSFEISNSSILTTALIIIGGLMLADGIPSLCRALYIYSIERNLSKFDNRRPDLSYSVLLTTKIIIGLLLLGERKRIASFILSKPNKILE